MKDLIFTNHKNVQIDELGIYEHKITQVPQRIIKAYKSVDGTSIVWFRLNHSDDENSFSHFVCKCKSGSQELIEKLKVFPDGHQFIQHELEGIKKFLDYFGIYKVEIIEVDMEISSKNIVNFEKHEPKLDFTKPAITSKPVIKFESTTGKKSKKHK
jgi:hypothetical protein